LQTVEVPITFIVPDADALDLCTRWLDAHKFDVVVTGRLQLGRVAVREGEVETIIACVALNTCELGFVAELIGLWVTLVLRLYDLLVGFAQSVAERAEQFWQAGTF